MSKKSSGRRNAEVLWVGWFLNSSEVPTHNFLAESPSAAQVAAATE